MVRKLFLVVMLLVSATEPTLLVAAPNSSSKPAGPTQITWEIVAYPRGGKGGLRVLERMTGSEARADARTGYYQARYPNLYVAYRKAR